MTPKEVRDQVVTIFIAGTKNHVASAVLDVLLLRKTRPPKQSCATRPRPRAGQPGAAAATISPSFPTRAW